MTIQLAFEPRGRDGASDAYFVCEKRNVCVVCGSATHFLRCGIAACGACEWLDWPLPPPARSLNANVAGLGWAIMGARDGAGYL